MKTKLFLSLLLSLAFCLLSSQVPQGMNYQAIARGSDGKEITNTGLLVKISILSDTTGFYATGAGTYIWEEQQSVTTNGLGLFTLVIGNPLAIKIQGSAASFSLINWTVPSLYIGTKIFYLSSWKILGSAKLWSVPYSLLAKNTETKQTLTLAGLDLSISDGNGVSLPAGSSAWQVSGSNIYRQTGNVGIGTSTPTSKVVVQPPTTWSDDAPLFEVKNKSGLTVFAVYNNGVRVYVEDDAPYKGSKGGFAVGGFNPAKGGYTNDFLWVTPDSVRVYVDNTVSKGTKGGFAVGGFTPAKGTAPILLTHLTELNYLIGHEAGSAITSGKYNTFFGYQAGRQTTGGTPSGFTYPGWANVFIGYQTGYNNTTGFKNVFLGYQSGQDNIDGYYNTFIGNATGANNTTGVKNTFVGNESGEANVSGSYNTFYGYNSGIMTSSSANTFVGADCGFNNTTGAYNAYFGSHAGEYFRGSYNTFLGTFAGRNYATLNTGNYNIFIGYSAGYSSGSISNKLYIDPSNTTAPLIYGDFTNGSEVVRINGNLEYTGTITDVSDIRLKKNIEQIPDVLEKIASLRGVYFDWNMDENPGFVLEDRRQVGIIAQEVEQVLPELVRLNKEGYRMVDYTKLTPVLIEAIKEQQKRIVAQDEKISRLEKLVEQLIEVAR